MAFCKFDYHETPARLQGLLHCQDDGLGTRKLVIGMRDKNQIKGSRRKARAGFITQHQFDVVELMLSNRFSGAVEHRWLYVNREDFAARSNRSRKAPGVIARARSQVRDRRTSRNFQSGDQRIGTLLGIPADAVQKLDTRIGMMRLTRPWANLGRGPAQSTKVTDQIADLRGRQTARIRRHDGAPFSA